MSASKGLDLDDIFQGATPEATPISAAAGEGKDAATHTNGKASSKAKPKPGKKATGKDKKKRKRHESDSDEAEESEADEAEDEEPAEDDDEEMEEEEEEPKKGKKKKATAKKSSASGKSSSASLGDILQTTKATAAPTLPPAAASSSSSSPSVNGEANTLAAQLAQAPPAANGATAQRSGPASKKGGKEAKPKPGDTFHLFDIKKDGGIYAPGASKPTYDVVTRSTSLPAGKDYSTLAKLAEVVTESKTPFASFAWKLRDPRETKREAESKKKTADLPEDEWFEKPLGLHIDGTSQLIVLDSKDQYTTLVGKTAIVKKPTNAQALVEKLGVNPPRVREIISAHVKWEVGAPLTAKMIEQWNEANKADLEKKRAAAKKKKEAEEEGDDEPAEAKPSPKKKRKTAAAAARDDDGDAKDVDMPQASLSSFKQAKQLWDSASAIIQMGRESVKHGEAVQFGLMKEHPELRKFAPWGTA